ncbi:MAG: biotin--[acetyl-CoA-carboxylase] ligase [Ignavibacteria bacterium]|nr:biotin--[acetyl-CoA-carboxylase] ligase [Ignavibacteria bacterium]
MFGKTRQHFDTLESTNPTARGLALEGAPHGAAVTADYQSGGRGRSDRVWHSPRGENLLVSYVTYPARPMEEWGGLSLLAGVAIHDVLHEEFSIDGDLKWPNDVLVGGRKIAGVLIEGGRSVLGAYAVIGIGLNVNQRVFDAQYVLPATSIALECGRDADREAVFEAMSKRLERCFVRWTERGSAAIAAAWRSRTTMLGRPASVRNGAEMETVTALDIGADGGLLVEDSLGRRRTLFAGDVIPRTAGERGNGEHEA